MTDKIKEITDLIISERNRVKDRHGSEFEISYTPNDWVSIINHYLSEEVSRGGRKPSKNEYQDSLIKAAVVIIAALENIDNMVSKKHLYLNEK